ncbi:MAG: hypothetical protein IPO67_23295 [Deltaproteobacteria bacterium]|nr:hypothetical protein [Deltaproteobacteria bacterium]
MQLLDCDGELIDVIVYGVAPNSDGWTDETGALVADADLAPEPGEGEVLARIDDGADTNLSATDVCVDTVSTPDAKNRTTAPETVPPGHRRHRGSSTPGDTSPLDTGGDTGGAATPAHPPSAPQAPPAASSSTRCSTTPPMTPRASTSSCTTKAAAPSA